ANLTLYSVFSKYSVAIVFDTPVARETNFLDLSISFKFWATTSTIKFSYTLPSLIMEPVVSIFSTIFCEVPDFSLVEPEITSGPTIGAIDKLAIFDIFEFGLLVILIVYAPILLPYSKPPIVYGVLPLAAIPTITSLELKSIFFKSSEASSLLSSAPSTASKIAL